MVDQAIRDQLNRIESTGNTVRAQAQQTGDRLSRLSQRLKLPEIINGLTLFLVLHNAIMLSGNVVQTIGDGISLGLSAIGFKDEDGNAYDINTILGKEVKELLISLVGQEAWNNANAAWTRANRVYQAGMNVIYSLNSIVDSTRAIVEIVGENTGKIGNALKRAGVVFDNSYGWMQEKLDVFSVGNARWERMFRTIDRADDVASSFSSTMGEVVSIQQNVQELKDNRAELNSALKDVGYGTKPQSQPIKDQEQTTKDTSQAPTTLDDPKVGAEA